MAVNVSIFKYPLGFIRVIEFLFVLIAIIAVNSWGVDVSYGCPEPSKNLTLKAHTSTFSLSNAELPTCTSNGTVKKVLWTSEYNAGGSSGFFYFVNVVTIIYILLISFVYVFIWELYQHEKRVPLLDLAVTALLFVLLFFCSSIWWAGANTIGHSTSTEEVSKLLQGPDFWNGNDTKLESTLHVDVSNSKLAISVLCDWVLVVSFAFNCWCVWKEIVPRQAENPSEIA